MWCRANGVGSRAAESSNLEDGSRCHALAELPKVHHRRGVLFRIENGDADDPIVFCDGCDLSTHKQCYGLPAVPEGDWFCPTCETRRKSGRE